MQWPFRAIAFANQCEHTSGPLGPLVCELSACKRPFRAFYMRCVCFCPLGQKHTRSTRNLPFRANCVCIWCTSGPKGPLVHVNKYYNAHTRLLLMAKMGENDGQNASKMAAKMGSQNVHKIIRSIISHEAEMGLISGEKDGKMALILVAEIGLILGPILPVKWPPKK